MSAFLNTSGFLLFLFTQQTRPKYSKFELFQSLIRLVPECLCAMIEMRLMYTWLANNPLETSMVENNYNTGVMYKKASI